jgi:hypothetical protein
MGDLEIFYRGMVMVYTSVEQIVKANKAAGEFFFSSGAMHGFRSRLSQIIYNGHFFIVSNQFVDGRGNADERTYDVCVVHDNGCVARVARKLSRYKAHKLAAGSVYTGLETEEE